MLLKKLKQKEDWPKETEYQFLLHSLKTHRQGAVVVEFYIYFKLTPAVESVASGEGRSSLVLITGASSAKHLSVPFRSLLFFLWTISRVLQRMGSSWDVAKESHNFQGAWSFEKKRKDLVKLLYVAFHTWKSRRNLASRREVDDKCWWFSHQGGNTTCFLQT